MFIKFVTWKRKLIMTLETDIVDIFSGDAAHDQTSLTAEQMRMMEELHLDFSKVSFSINLPIKTFFKLNSPLFTGEEEVFAFQRAISRLVEMQSSQVLFFFPFEFNLTSHRNSGLEKSLFKFSNRWTII